MTNKKLTTVSVAMRVSAPSGVLVQELDGESVFLNINSERYFGLDEVGTRMWQVLTTAESIQRACETLQEEFDVAPEQLRQDLLALIDKLVEHGLVEVSGV
jgi:hypothetical protein